MIRIWLGFIGWSALVSGAIGLVAQSVLGAERAGAVWMGVMASLIGAIAGSLPLAAELAEPGGAGGKPVAAIGKATAFRLLVTLGTTLIAAVAGNWDRRILLGSVGASYLALLAVETGWFLKQARKELGTH